jgi:hypothetical protein
VPWSSHEEVEEVRLDTGLSLENLGRDQVLHEHLVVGVDCVLDPLEGFLRDGLDE